VETPSLPYTLQVAAFRTEARAQRLVQQLAAKGYQPYVVRQNAWYLVRVGQFPSQEAAQEQARLLEAQERLTPLVRKVTP
jgi:cell division septation protein DedD